MLNFIDNNTVLLFLIFAVCYFYVSFEIRKNNKNPTKDSEPVIKIKSLVIRSLPQNRFLPMIFLSITLALILRGLINN